MVLEAMILCAALAQTYDSAIWVEPADESCEVWEVYGKCMDTEAGGFQVYLDPDLAPLVDDFEAEAPFTFFSGWDYNPDVGRCPGWGKGFGCIALQDDPVNVDSVLIGTFTFTEAVDLDVSQECEAYAMVRTGFYDGYTPNMLIDTAAPPTAPCDCPWDLDSSGDVGTGDFLIVIEYWGYPFSQAYGVSQILANWGVCP